VIVAHMPVCIPCPGKVGVDSEWLHISEVDFEG
jgi:hypothetical protein